MTPVIRMMTNYKNYLEKSMGPQFPDVAVIGVALRLKSAASSTCTGALALRFVLESASERLGINFFFLRAGSFTSDMMTACHGGPSFKSAALLPSARSHPASNGSNLVALFRRS